MRSEAITTGLLLRLRCLLREDEPPPPASCARPRHRAIGDRGQRQATRAVAGGNVELQRIVDLLLKALAQAILTASRPPRGT